MTKLKKISWQAIMIVGLVFTIITSIILGLSGAWFQGKDGAGTEGKLGHAVVVRLKDVETNDNVRGWEEIYDSTKTQAYPGDTLIGSTQIQMASTSPALIRVQVEPIVQATSDGGANYTKVTYTDTKVPVTLDGVETPKSMTDANVEKYYNKLISLKPKRSTYTDAAAYRQDYLEYYDKAKAWNDFIFKNLTEQLDLSKDDWNKKSGWWYFNKIYGDTTKPSELKTGTLPLFNKLVLSPYLTDEVAQWKVSIILKVEAIQAAHRDDPTHPWYDDIKDMPFDGSYVEETDELQTLSLSDFNYEVVDEGTEGTFSEADGDYIKLLSVKKNVAKFEVKSHYSIYTDDKTPAPETSTESSTTSATNGGARLASRSLKVLADDREIAKLPVRFIGGSGLFANAKSIVLPDTVDTIGNEAFKDSDIEDISIKDSTSGEVLPVLSNGSVSEAPEAKDWMDGVYIGNEAFVGTDIDNVTIPTGVDFTINENAFDPDTKYTYDGKTYDNLEDLKDAMGDRLTIDHSALYTPAVGSGGDRVYTYYDPAGAYTYELRGKGTFTYDIVDGDIVIRTFAPSDTTNGVTDLEIPSTIDGKTVVGVNSESSGKALNYPNYYFMQDRTLLKGTLTIPASVTDVGDSFDDSAIEALIIQGEKLKGGFSRCGDLKAVTANNLVSISSWMFGSCTSLKSVSFPKVTAIGYYAFSRCIHLEDVDVPYVTSIDEYAFGECTALKRFNSSVDAVFDLHNVSVIYGARNTSDEGAFQGCTSVEKVYFGQNVYIGARAFKNCSNLKNIYFVDDNGTSSQSVLRTLAATSGDIDASNYADDTASASYITTATYKSDLNKDSYKYAVSTNAGKILVNGTEVTEFEPGTYDLTIDTTNCGYIHSISYSVPTTSGAETQTISVDGYPTQHTITNFVFTRGVSFDVTRYYKLTDENGNVSYVEDYKKSPENYNDEANTVDYYSYSFGENPYDVTRTKGGTYGAYEISFECNGIDVTEELDYEFKHKKIYDYNNYLTALPTYGIRNGRKWIAGWRDNNGHEYLFERKFTENGYPNATSERVHIINPTGDITLTPIWSTEDGPSITLSGGPNKAQFEEEGLYYTYNGFVLPEIYGDYGHSYWWDEGNQVGCGEYQTRLYISELRSSYNFEAQIIQSDEYIWTDGLDNLVGYGGKVYNSGGISFDTGWKETNSPTTTKSAKIGGGYRGYYILPLAPTANEGYYFRGWKCDIAVKIGYSIDDASEQAAGTAISAGREIYTLENANWTAVWLKVTLISGNDVAYSGDMGSIDYYGSYFQLPKITTTTGYAHVGWTCDKDVKVYDSSSGGTKIVAAGTQIASNAQVYSFDEYIFTAVWAKSPNAYNITFDLDGKSDDEGLAISYSDGDSYYELPAVQTTKDNYILIGWSCNIDLTINGEVVSKGTVIDIYMGNSRIETFADCVYTAHYVKVTLNTGYLSENSPTPNETANIEFGEFESGIMWPRLPKLEANTGWVFKGWRLDTEVFVFAYDVNAQDEEAFIFLNKDDVMPVGEMIYMCMNMEDESPAWVDHIWTAVWEKADA